MPDISLPDGSVKSFPQPVTVAEIAQSIGTGLARAAICVSLRSLKTARYSYAAIGLKPSDAVAK